jgi:hypothetical protein
METRRHWLPGPTGCGPVMAAGDCCCGDKRRCGGCGHHRGQGSSGRLEKKTSQQKKAQQDQQAAKGKTRPTDLASVSLTGTLVRRLGSVSSPAPGRETRPPGVWKRHHPWQSSLHCG